MMQQRVRFAATPDRHDQGIGDQLCRHARVHRPANDATGEQVNDHSHVEPAFRRPDIGEVSDPFAIGGTGFEAAVENIRSDGGGCRSPTSDGSRRRRGRARSACSRINRSMRCRRRIPPQPADRATPAWPHRCDHSPESSRAPCPRAPRQRERAGSGALCQISGTSFFPSSAERPHVHHRAQNQWLGMSFALGAPTPADGLYQIRHSRHGQMGNFRCVSRP